MFTYETSIKCFKTIIPLDYFQAFCHANSYVRGSFISELIWGRMVAKFEGYWILGKGHSTCYLSNIKWLVANNGGIILQVCFSSLGNGGLEKETFFIPIISR